MRHLRFIFPVGQGGLAIEMIDDYVVAYDCGSTSSPGMVEQSIDCLIEFIDHIDVLFISHFDKDHVNGIQYLLSKIWVRLAVTSFIPDQLKIAYGVYTDGAYSDIMALLRQSEVEINEIGGQENETGNFQFQDVWEWIAKSMMTNSEFSRILAYIAADGIDVESLVDASYIEKEKAKINRSFKSVFGSKGPNAKGLVVLSQHSRSAITSGTIVTNGGCPCVHRSLLGHQEESSCLFVGDADLKNIANRKTVINFYVANRTEEVLLFMQIPHHGSRHNIDINLESDFPAQYFFVNDVNTNRLRKTKKLYTSLSSKNKLLVSRPICRDLIRSETVI